VTIYIEEEIDSMVLFPLESGKFKSNQVVIGRTYEVHWEPISGSPDATQKLLLHFYGFSMGYIWGKTNFEKTCPKEFFDAFMMI